MSEDKLVVGYQEFVKAVASGLATTDEHSCVDETRPDYKAMAKTLWASGYRFDPAARRAWLIVHMRANLPADLQDAFRELCELGGLTDA